MRRLLAADLEPLPENVIVENEIRDPRTLTDSVQRLLQRALPSGQYGDLVTSVNWTSGILCDRIAVRVDKGRNEDETILQTAMSRSPFDDTDNVLDYEVVNRREDGTVEALVVAAKSNMLNSWANFLVNAGLKPAAIDVDAFAVCNAFFASSGGLELDKPVAIFNMGEKKSHLSYVKDGVFQTARNVQSGNLDNALQLVSRHMGLEPSVCRSILQGKTKAGFDAEALQNAMEFVCEEMAMGIEIAMRYFATSGEGSSKPACLLLTGGGASLPGLVKLLAYRLQFDVRTLQPLEGLEVEPGSVRVEGDPVALANIFAPALGLALRRF